MAKTNSAIWVKHVKTFSAMTNVIINMKNPEPYKIWVSRFMNYEDWDGSTKYVACHDDVYNQASNLFLELIKIYGKDGIS